MRFMAKRGADIPFGECRHYREDPKQARRSQVAAAKANKDKKGPCHECLEERRREAEPTQEELAEEEQALRLEVEAL